MWEETKKISPKEKKNWKKNTKSNRITFEKDKYGNALKIKDEKRGGIEGKFLFFFCFENNMNITTTKII